jgi:hypothetical protein
MKEIKPVSERSIKSRCARCHRFFTPKKEGQIYGPTCAMKEAAAVEAIKRYGIEAPPVII